MSEEVAMPAASSMPRRRRLRISLRMLLVLVTVACVVLGIEKSRMLKQQRAVARVRAMKGDVFFGYRFDSVGRPKEFSNRVVPRWLTNLICEECFLTVVTVNFDDGYREGNVADGQGPNATDNGLEMLDDLPNVTELLLAGNNQLTDAFLVHVRGLKNLRVLTLDRTSVAGPGLAHIGSLANLEGLTLNNTPLTDEGLAHLRNLPKLESLQLSGTLISDDGVLKLASLNSLRGLQLNHTKITDRSLIPLKKMHWLTRLSLSDTYITQEGMAELRLALPNCQIYPQ